MRDFVTNCDEFIMDLIYNLNILPEQTCATNRQFSRSLHPIVNLLHGDFVIEFYMLYFYCE